MVQHFQHFHKLPNSTFFLFFLNPLPPPVHLKSVHLKMSILELPCNLVFIFINFYYEYFFMSKSLKFRMYEMSERKWCYVHWKYVRKKKFPAKKRKTLNEYVQFARKINPFADEREVPIFRKFNPCADERKCPIFRSISLSLCHFLPPCLWRR